MPTFLRTIKEVGIVPISNIFKSDNRHKFTKGTKKTYNVLC
jgi:hypothetical protein